MSPRNLTQYEIDDMYSTLALSHEGLDPTQSNLLNASAVFLLAAHVDIQTLTAIMQKARDTALQQAN